jgi:abhydrolase domain-containing protein 13
MNLLQGIACAGAGLVGSFLLALFTLQEHLLYHPNIPTRAYPELPTDYAMQYEDAEIVTADGVKLHAWLILQPGGASRGSPHVTYFHGNAGSISHRLMDVRQFYMSGFNLLIVSYRGYGQSEGKPSEKGFKLDAAAAIDYVADRSDVLDTKQLFLFGRSIGGAVALAAAAAEAKDRNRIRGVIVENTFTSIGYVARGDLRGCSSCE